MASQSITIRIDEDIKRQAEVILGDSGWNIATVLDACLKAVVRERRVPFVLSGGEYEQWRMINAKLDESEAAANDPTAKRYSHDDVFTPLRKQYGYEL